MSFQIHVENGYQDGVNLPPDAQFNLWARTALQPFREDGEVNIRIVGNDEMTDLNRQYRNKNQPTNVLAFAYHPESSEVDPLLGDIAICAPVVMAEARQQNKPVEHHWAHLVMHGTLHLLGFDHIDSTDAEKMEQQETELLAQLSIPNPYESNPDHSSEPEPKTHPIVMIGNRMNQSPKNPEPDPNWLSRAINYFRGDRSSAKQQLKTVLREAEKDKVIDFEALSIIEGAMQVSNMQVRDIMIPRSQLITVCASDNPTEFLPTIIESGHSRFPVIGEGPDEIVGILLAKDLLPLSLSGNLDQFQIKDHLRTATVVPESKALNILLREFRTNHNHMAVVVDEYGHFGGAVTIEDVLEQIVGEIEDEYDVDDDSYIKKFDDNTFVVKALTEIEEFNDYFKADFSSDEFDTIGGIVLQNFGRLPKRDDSTTLGFFKFTVLNADNRRIHLLRLTFDDTAEQATF